MLEITDDFDGCFKSHIKKKGSHMKNLINQKVVDRHSQMTSILLSSINFVDLTDKFNSISSISSTLDFQVHDFHYYFDIFPGLSNHPLINFLPSSDIFLNLESFIDLFYKSFDNFNFYNDDFTFHLSFTIGYSYMSGYSKKSSVFKSSFAIYNYDSISNTLNLKEIFNEKNQI